MRFLCFLFWAGFLNLIYSQQSTDISQEYFVYGKIIQKNRQPIPQVNVSFLGYENETYTDHEGKFFLKIPKNSFKLDLIFKKKEFESQIKKLRHELERNDTPFLSRKEERIEAVASSSSSKKPMRKQSLAHGPGLKKFNQNLWQEINNDIMKHC